MKIMTDVKEKMMKHQRIACAFLRIPDPSIAEVMAGEGVDLLVIDQEHYVFNEETMLHIIRAAGCYQYLYTKYYQKADNVKYPFLHPSLTHRVKNPF